MHISNHSKIDAYALVRGTVEVINKALEQHLSDDDLGPIAPLVDKLASGRDCGVAVYKAYSDTPSDYFTVWLNRGRVELAGRDRQTQFIAWKVSQDSLQQVCEQPQIYIDNPARLGVEVEEKDMGTAAKKPPFSDALQAYSQTQGHCPRIGR